MNVIAFILTGTAVHTLGLDLIIQFNAAGSFCTDLVCNCTSALIPSAGFLLYFHYRLKKSFDLERFFRF